MMNLHSPKHIRKFADLTKDLCKDGSSSLQYLALKMLFEFFFNQYDSVSDLIRQNAWTMSESHFFRTILGFEGSRFLRRMRRSILKKYKGQLNPKDFILALDDTDNPRYSKYLSHVQSWRSSKGMYYGQKVLVLALVNVNDGFCIPVDFKFCVPKKEQKKDGKDNALELAFEMIMKASSSFKGIYVVADSWFDCSNLAKKLDKRKIVFIWELKSTRKAKIQNDLFEKYFFLKELFCSLVRICVNSSKNKWISESVIRLNSNKIIVKAIAAYNRKNGKDPFAFYASTDKSMPGERV